MQSSPLMEPMTTEQLEQMTAAFERNMNRHKNNRETERYAHYNIPQDERWADSLPKVRHKILKVMPDFLFHVFTNGRFNMQSCLPSDSRLISSGFDPHTQLFYFVIESDAFEPVSQGERLPEIGGHAIVFQRLRDGAP